MGASGGIPCTCTAPPSLVGSAIGKFSYGASIARGACGVWKVRSALLTSLKTEMSSDGSCNSGRRMLRLGRSCNPSNPMLKLPPPPRVLCPPPSPHPDGDSSLPAITSANASPTSPPLAMEELDDHPNAPTETAPPPPCSNTTQPSRTGMVNMRPVCGEDVLAAVCHALINGLGSPTAQLQHVESLLRDEWEGPLDVIIPSSGSQQYRLEAYHLRDVYSESCVTDSAEIVVYNWWLTQTALSADWYVMGVAWVVRDSLWNVSSAPWDRRKVLAELWALRTLEAAPTRGGRLLGSGTRLPPPPPCPPGPLSYQGSIATGHTNGGTEGARNFFFHSPCPRSIPPRPGGGAPQRYT